MTCDITCNVYISKRQREFLSSGCFVFSAHLVSRVKAQVLVTLFTVMVGVVGRVFRELYPGCPPAQVHILLTHSISFEIQPDRIRAKDKSSLRGKK